LVVGCRVISLSLSRTYLLPRKEGGLPPSSEALVVTTVIVVIVIVVVIVIISTYHSFCIREKDDTLA